MYEYENRAFNIIWDGYLKRCGGIVRIYVLAMAILFPFYASDRYFRILRDRTQFFIVATMITTASVLIITFYYFIQHLRERYNEGLHIIPERKELRQYLRHKAAALQPADGLFLLFLAVCSVSTLTSGSIKECFLGTQGRYQGLLIWLLYGAAYFMIRKFLRLGKGICDLFLCSGLLLSVWGITDYIGLDIFGWLAMIQEGQRGTFTSAFGNINTYTAGMAIFFALSGIGFIYAVRRTGKGEIYHTFFYAVVFISAGVSMITGQSDNAVIGIAIFFLGLPFAAWRTKCGFFGSLFLFALLLLAFMITAALNGCFANPYIDSSGGILLRISNNIANSPVFLTVVLLLLLVSACGLANCRKKGSVPGWSGRMPHSRMVLGIWGITLALGVFCLFFLLCDANLWHPERYGSYAKYLIFNDSWGTSRGFCWRIAMEEYQKFPVWKKWIGSGPETFGIIVKQTRYQEMVAVCGQTFDSPHNEALQYLFTTGIAGAVSYYTFLAYGCIKGMISRDGIKEAAAVAVVVYTFVSFVNISVPITQPYIILLMAVILAKPD